jgi:dTDP-glucose 4,6-dehydratase
VARLLITGGAGFIGANFADFWLTEHPEDRIVVLDALTYAGNRENLARAESCGAFRFVHGDIRDTALVEQLLREERLSTIVHFAAESHVDRSIDGPDAFIDTNIVGTHSMLKAARRAWLDGDAVPEHRFHHVSTDEVYGSLEANDPPFTESTPYAPNSPYSASKAASDHLVRAYQQTYGLRTTVSNCSNNYGPYQFGEKMIPLMIGKLLEGAHLPVYGDGRNIRDWLHVHDHCRAIDAVLEFGKIGEVYNIGGDAECDNIRLVNLLCTLVDAALESSREDRARFPRALASRGLHSQSLISYVKDRPGHDRRYAIDSNKIRRDCGFSARIGLDAGLRATVAWYMKRSHGADRASVARRPNETGVATS